MTTTEQPMSNIDAVFLTRKELAARWKVTEGHLRNLACKRLGPAVTRLGGAVRYKLEHVEAYEAKALS